jgi:hypothetical protein
MNAIAEPQFEFTLTCETSDPYDASIRLLNDAQRFGAELVNLHFAAAERILSLTIRVSGETDPRNLADRFWRHRAIVPVISECVQ